MEFTDIKQSLNFMLSHANEHGVVVLEAGQPGPCACVCALTHGNEISGVVSAAKILAAIQNGALQLKAGKLVFMLANYEILASAQGLDDLTRHRGVDLNRIWADDIPVIQAGQPGAGEFAVRERLLATLVEADFLIDLHSTSLPSTAMGIALADSPATMAWMGEHLDVPYLLPNISTYLNGTAMIERHHAEAVQKPGNKHFSLVIEAGQHFDFSTIDKNTANVKRLLQLSGVLAGTAEPVATPPVHLEVYEVGLSSAVNEDVTWLYSSSPGGFDKVIRGTPICTLGGRTYVAQHDTYIVMPQIRSNRIGHELFYLAKA